MHSPLPRSFATHDGAFHADEVTACALLLLFDCIDRTQIIRTRDPQRLQKCDYVCDVGGVYQASQHLFDHHQADYKGPLSSAGMILEHLHASNKIDSGLYRYLQQMIILGVDEHDNGKDPQIAGLCSYSHLIANFNPIQQDCTAQEQDAAFYIALDLAYGHLKRLYERYLYVQSCRILVQEQMQQKGDCLYFDQNIPWLESFFDLGGADHPAKFVLMPSGSHWKLRGIPPSYQQRMDVRLQLPQAWAGLLDDELQRVSGIPGAIFCHKGRFISVWETKEAALQALNYILKKKEESDEYSVCQNHPQ
jgi:uncharacterized UPF0160 family protein